MSLRAEHVTLGYGAHQVLTDCSIALKPGETVFLLGVNGAGKSTLMKAMAGFLPPHSGRICWDGTDLYQMPPRLRAQKVAYLGQQIPAADMTVMEYVLLGAAPYLHFGAVPGKSWEERAGAVLEQLDLADFAHRSMMRISGGERQRAALGQVLLSDAQTLLLDEPSASLDVRCQHEFLQYLMVLAREKGKSTLISVHDPNLALRYADRVAALDRGRLELFENNGDLGEKLADCLRRSYGDGLCFGQRRVFDWS